MQRTQGQSAIGPPNSLTITLIGDPGSGKTSLKKRLIGKQFHEKELMTVGAEYTFLSSQLQGIAVKLKICDIPGQPAYVDFRSNFMARSDAALMVFDLTNEKSFLNVMNWLKDFIRSNKDAKSNLPILLIGNKSDLTEERSVKLSQITAFLKAAEEHPRISKHVIGFLETSAKTGENISESFNWLTNSIRINTN